MTRVLPAVVLLVTPAFAVDLPQRVAAILAEAPRAVRGAVGVHIADVASGNVLVAQNEQQLFLPASNLKLFTAALALERLGPDYRFETRLVREPSGALVLVGGGDPTLSGRMYPYDATANLQEALRVIDGLVERAVAAGLTRVDGDVIGDDRRYPWSPYPESWTTDDALHDYGAPVSALSFNDNYVSVRMRPGAQNGALARISVEPSFEYFTIDNRVVTSTAAGADTVRVVRIPGSRQLQLTGEIHMRTPDLRLNVAVDDPAAFTARALYDALARHGIPVRGRPQARHRMGAEPVEATGDVLAVRQSPPLAEILQTMIKVSQNLHAEMLLREVGTLRQGLGTVEGGLRELRVFLGEVGIAPAEFVSEDGSGLARNDEITPRAITRLLVAMAGGPRADVWRSLFPVGGQDGTLSSRLCCTTESAAIRAKTGSLSRAVSLSGYADSRGNGRLAFAILVNNFAAPAADVRAWVDRLATALIE